MKKPRLNSIHNTKAKQATAITPLACEAVRLVIGGNVRHTPGKGEDINGE